MIERISYWTPVVQNDTNREENLPHLRIFDELFDLGGRTVKIIKAGGTNTHVQYMNGPTSYILRAIKIATFVIAFFTVIPLVAKYYYRKANNFVVVTPSEQPTKTKKAASPILTDDLSVKFDEIGKSSEYLTGYLCSIEKFLKEAQVRNKAEDVTILFYIHQMLVEIAPTIDIFETESLILTEKLSKSGIIDKDDTTGYTTVIQQYHGIQNALRERIRLAAPSLKKTMALYEKKFNKLDAHGQEYVCHFLQFVSEYLDKETYTKTLEATPALRNAPSLPVKQATGIQNQGNSCWLSACIQSLFAAQPILNGLNEIKENIDRQPEHLKPILASMEALREFMTNGCRDPNLLGEVSGQLRLAVFNGSIQDYDPLQINAFQDPGPMYRLLMENLGMKYTLHFSRTAVGVDYNRTEQNIEYLFPISTEGNSIQEAVNSLAAGVRVETKGWKPVDGLEVAEAVEKSTILGKPPRVFVFRVKENYNGRNQHKIQAADLQINMGNILSNNSSPRYRLVGFAQNRSSAHWVAYALRGSTWSLFNDDTVTQNPTIIGQDAHYLVYEQM